MHKRTPGQYYSGLRVICRLIKAFSSKKMKGRMMKRFNMLNIQPFFDFVSLMCFLSVLSSSGPALVPRHAGL